MKTVELVEVVQTYKRVAEVKCDRCGLRGIDNLEEGEFVYRFDAHFLWGQYSQEKVEMEGWGIDDLCPDCGDKLKEVLEQNGFKIAPRQLNWY